MRRSCDLPGRILPKRGYWPVNIFQSASGLSSITSSCSFAFSFFRGCLQALQAPQPPRRSRPAANIANMMTPIILGIGNAIPQVTAHAYRTGGVIGASRAAYGYVLFGLAPILVICAAAVLVPELLLRTVYGPSSPYLAVAMGLQLLAVAGVLDYIAEMASKTLLGVRGRQARLSGQCCGCRRGGGARFRADRPVGRIRRVPRPFDRQPGARDRRRARDFLADR